jgi:hypothetical protein
MGDKTVVHSKWGLVAAVEGMLLAGALIAIAALTPANSSSILSVVALIFSVVSMLSQIIFGYLGFHAGNKAHESASAIEARINHTAGQMEQALQAQGTTSSAVFEQAMSWFMSDISRRGAGAQIDPVKVGSELETYVEVAQDPAGTNRTFDNQTIVVGSRVNHLAWGPGMTSALGEAGGVEWADIVFDNSDIGRRRLDLSTAPLLRND